MSYRYGINPKIPHPDDRPRCVTCEVKAKQIRGHYNDGSPNYRSECAPCYRAKLLKRHKKKGVKVKCFEDILAQNAGFASVKEYRKHLMFQAAQNAGFASVKEYRIHLNSEAAKAAGFDNVIDWKNSTHPYRKYRKDYCENIDERLGFECTTTIAWSGMLEVDHINGMPFDHRPRNLQTLCKCCHAYKTNVFKDYATPGRKKIKELKIKERMAA
jgi:hypothetical protein